jgi:S-adenosylmethionine:tRNA ribosyltransferase-isomerase
MTDPGEIRISDYWYELPQKRIAQYPLEHRDRSKLLIYRDGRISQDIFRGLAGHLPADSLLIFNETRVIPARIIIQKPTGAKIEIFCLEPAGLVNDYQLALEQGPGCEWKCFIGNARRWKNDTLSVTLPYEKDTLLLSAKKVSRHDDHFTIRFDWEPGSLSFSDILEAFGRIPLPPYIRREADENDRERYQTVFAREKGSIAAPTAGLHFTGSILDDLKARGIRTATVSLHVGAGTFKPVTSEKLSGHPMHTEYVSVSTGLLREVIHNPHRKIVLVGTTTVRTMESLYWQGVAWHKERPSGTDLRVGQWDPYRVQEKDLISLPDAFGTLLEHLEADHRQHISGYTSLMIAPGYRYRVPDAIITNFHMPQSTLLLLVAAYIGQDWKKAYKYALDEDFRFLSYGDSCLFFHPGGHAKR